MQRLESVSSSDLNVRTNATLDHSAIDAQTTIFGTECTVMPIMPKLQLVDSCSGSAQPLHHRLSFLAAI